MNVRLRNLLENNDVAVLSWLCREQYGTALDLPQSYNITLYVA